MSAASDRGQRINPRQLWPSAVAAGSVIWRSAPVDAAGYLVATVASAAAPVATAWLTKSVIDRLTMTHGAVGGLALGLVLTGIGAAALPVYLLFDRAQIGRAASMTATERLFAAAERQVGLRNFEDPAFLDRLRLAQEGANRIGEIVDSIGGLLGGLLALIGFIASLLRLSWTMAALVLLAAIPALGAEIVLSLRRASMEWGVEQFNRREIFYSQLLIETSAATEIRLFGTGASCEPGCWPNGSEPMSPTVRWTSAKSASRAA